MESNSEKRAEAEPTNVWQFLNEREAARHLSCLGDNLSGNSLAAPVEDTITKTLGKVMGLMYEVAAIIKDHRMQVTGDASDGRIPGSCTSG